MLFRSVINGKEMSQFVTDFTWYMRNLLLVKSSTEAKEAIDMATESLKTLEEESKMVDDITLMRFIRIFSELSNQIRYASQKRVLVEIALIKLCRPAMEQDTASMLERIRILEKKISEGVTFIEASPKGQSGVHLAKKEAPKVEVKPPKAAPEDIVKVKNEWRMIVGQTSGLLKNLLHTAVPKYNSQTGESKLYIEFTNNMAGHHVENPAVKEELENIILKRIGKHVDVEMSLANEPKAHGLAEISVDDILKDKVKMDVAVENDFQDD